MDMNILDANNRAVEEFGYSREELLKKKVFELHPKEELHKSKQVLEVMKKKDLLTVETKFIRKDGSVFFAEATPCKYTLGSKPVIHVVIRDITERKQAEDVLITNEAQLSIAMEISKLGYWEYNAIEDLFTFNDHFYNIFRTTAEKVGGYKMTPAQYAERFLHPDDRVMVTNEMKKAFETTDPNFNQTLEHRIIYADGEIGYILVRYFIVKDEHGRTIKTYGANQDITERKRQQTEKRDLENQFRESQKMESIGTLAGGIAHDFNNLLTVIQGHAQMAMLAMNESNPQYKDLTQIMNSSTRAASLTRQLLMFSRKQTVELKTLDLNQTIRNLLKMIQRLIGENIKVNTNMASDLPNVQADEGNIEQVIMNLAVNARDAMPDGGKLTIKTENILITDDDQKYMPESRIGSFVRISVQDSGIGIPKEILSKIFEPFYSTKEKGKGTGLGLSVVYGIVKSHGGWINVYSEPEQGTVFKIYLPASVSAFSEESATQAESKESLYGNGEKILVIEDEQGILDLASTALRQYGYVIQVASNGQEAKSVFEESKGNFQLIISDVILPDINGFDLVTKLIVNNPSIPVVMCSGYTEERVKQSIIQDKGFRFLQKPYSVSALLEMVSNTIQKS